ncbi:hypothetical protein FACS189425_09430 [Clostridia bacterium]|nr:hypothetical protein FACS189425_09430 [Clostridia bacterium]
MIDVCIELTNEILDIYRHAQLMMKAHGNFNQWGDVYPSREILLDDITKSQLYLLYDNDKMAGVFCLKDNDPFYEQAEWLNNEPYMTIDRLAYKQAKRKYVDELLDFCKGKTRNIRVDTGRENVVVQKMLVAKGFVNIGTILRDHDYAEPMLAYHWEAN